MLSHYTGQGWMGSDYHFAMSTQNTNQVLLVFQFWQSSNKIEPLKHETNSKLKWPNRLSKFHSLAETPATKQWGGPSDCEKSTRKTWLSGTIVRTWSPRESSTREAPNLKCNSQLLSRSWETKSKLSQVTWREPPASESHYNSPEPPLLRVLSLFHYP